MRKIAITGGIAAGKSTVCQILREFGAYVVDADEIVHRLLSPQTTVGQKVIELLGPDVVVGNQIDRRKVSEIVFSNPKKLRALEAILHPAVKQIINQEYQTINKKETYPFFVAEIPLLYEIGMEDEFETIIAVICDEKIARNRSKSFDNFEPRSSQQLPSSIKAAKADFVITNNGDLNMLRTSVQKLFQQLRTENQ